MQLAKPKGVAIDTPLMTANAARMAEELAISAERTADLFEGFAARHDAESKLVLANWERDVAAVERYNAARLRSNHRPFGLLRMPPYPSGENAEIS